MTESKGITRRDFIRAGLITGAGFFLGGGCAIKKSKNKPFVVISEMPNSSLEKKGIINNNQGVFIEKTDNSLLEEKFNQDIKNRVHLEEKLNSGDLGIIYHLKQKHFVDIDYLTTKMKTKTGKRFKRKLANKTYLEINNIQKQIGLFIQEFKKKYPSLKGLFVEGCFSTPTLEENRIIYEKRIKKIASLTNLPLSIVRERYKYTPGIQSLLYNKGWKIFPVDDPIHFLMQLQNFMTTKNMSKIIRREREDYVVEKIAKKGDKINLLLFGEAHDFKDNIDRWNKSNPSKQYRLIEVTPELSGKEYANR